MAYILLWFITSNLATPPSPGSTEFSSYESCREAGMALGELAKRSRDTIYWICVQK